MLGRVFDFLFPLECIACGAPGAHGCGPCVASIRMSPRFWSEPGLRASGAFAYAHPFVRRLVHDLKFERYACALPALERLARAWCAKAGTSFCPDGAFVVPVPLHPRRLRERGFNQAELLAEPVASALGLALRRTWLVRTRRTVPQTETEERAENVAGAFSARLPASAKGRPILLIDDVWTTGATMRACAAALRAAGAGEICGFALAWGSGLPKESQKT